MKIKTSIVHIDGTYNTNLIIATLGSTLTGALYDATGSYRAFSMVFLLLTVVGIALIFAVTAFDRKKAKV